MKVCIIVIDPGCRTPSIENALRSYRKRNACIWTTFMSQEEFPDYHYYIDPEMIRTPLSDVRALAAEIQARFQTGANESRVDDGHGLLHMCMIGRSGSGKTKVILKLLLALHERKFPMKIEWIGLQGDHTFFSEFGELGNTIQFHSVEPYHDHQIEHQLARLFDQTTELQITSNTPKVSMSDDLAKRLFDSAFDMKRTARSKEYKEGVMSEIKAELEKLLTGELLDGYNCPYPEGTAQADAWFAGTTEGTNIVAAYNRKMPDHRPRTHQ